MMEKQNQSNRKTIISGLFWKFAERIGAQGVTFIVSLVLARLLMPEDYGTITMVMVFINLCDVFVKSGFGQALIQKKDADNLDFSTVFYFSIVASIILFGLMWIVSPFIAKFYDMPLLTDVMRVMAIRIPIAGINSVQQAYVQKTMQFKRFFYSTLAGTVGSAIVGITMAYHGLGVWALVGQYMFNSVIDTLVLWLTVKWRPIFRFSFARLRHLYSYGWKLLLSALIDTGYSQLSNLIIGKYYSEADLAFYSKGQQFPNLLVVNINTTISTVLFPAVAKEQESLERVKELTRKAIKISSYVLFPALIGLAVVSKPLVKILLTEKWVDCVIYMQFACIMYALWPIHTTNLNAIQAIGRSDLFLKLEIIKKIVGVLLLVISVPKGIIAISISMVINSILASFINAWPNRKLLNYSYWEQVKDVLPSVVNTAIMALAIYPISRLGFNDIKTLLSQIIVGGIVYIALSAITRNSTFKYLLQMVKKNK